MTNNDILAREIKKNLDIMDATFSKYNLKIIRLSIKPHSSNGDSDFDLLFELTTISGNTIPCNLKITANMYDHDDELCLSNVETLSQDKFEGYDTVFLSFYDDGKALQNTKSGRIYVTKY